MATSVMTSSDCGCGNGHGAALVEGLERTRYYPRQLVNAEDLTQDQRYVRDKMRRHNRLLHGWGVVCGACVRLNRQNPCEVVVDPGYILGPRGDEIFIPEPVPFDVCKQGVIEQIGCCPDTEDPWCAEPRTRCPEGRFFLAVRYAECPSRPVRAGACGCGCDGDGCEYTRVRDSFALKLLSELPQGYSTPMPQPSFMGQMTCQGVAKTCPPCPDHPWVILADITIGRDCRVVNVDCFAHRRNVLSFASFFYLCQTLSVTPPHFGGATVLNAGMERIRMMSSLTGGSDMVDMSMAASAAAPRAMITMTRPTGETVGIPAFFTVDAGMTVADLIEREGDREFFDPVSNRRVTLRNLYALSDADPGTVLNSAASALAPLEGRVLDLPGLATGRALLEETLDDRGIDRLDRDLMGAPGRAAEMPATMLRGVEPKSPLATRLKKLSIAGVAEQPKEEFVAAVLKNAPARSRTDLESQAARTWEAAARVAGLRKRPDA
ncbi:MAG TPA: hypothetical protein VJU15_08330 [Gemmatimonadales bacterium]|nr:hypothetical protein [Gemmatimonadales bacterium]